MLELHFLIADKFVVSTNALKKQTYLIPNYHFFYANKVQILIHILVGNTVFLCHTKDKSK